jgi:hypothetical protein
MGRSVHKPHGLDLTPSDVGIEFSHVHQKSHGILGVRAIDDDH